MVKIAHVLPVVPDPTKIVVAPANYLVHFILPVPTTFESLRARLAADPGCKPNGHEPVAVGAIKARVRVPIFVNGGLHDPVKAEQIAASGAGDAVMLGRALLTDLEWAGKVLGGRIPEIQGCDCNPPLACETS